MVKPNRLNISQQIRKLHSLHRQLAALGPLVRGSVVRLGQRKTPMLSLNKAGKTHLVYLGESRLDQAQAYSQNYKILLDIIEKMTLINMSLLKAGVPHPKIAPPSRKRLPPNTPAL